MDLETRFSEVKAQFFPTWDIEGEWRVTHDLAGLRIAGLCDPENRLIRVLDAGNDVQRDHLIIHEICHAISTPEHGEEWIEKMLEAREVALSLNRLDLAQEILMEVEDYEADSEDEVEEQYEIRVRDLVFEEEFASFEEVLRILQDEFGGDAASFPKAKKTFDTCWKQIRFDREQQEKIRKAQAARAEK